MARTCPTRRLPATLPVRMRRAVSPARISHTICPRTECKCDHVDGASEPRGSRAQHMSASLYACAAHKQAFQAQHAQPFRTQLAQAGISCAEHAETYRQVDHRPWGTRSIEAPARRGLHTLLGMCRAPQDTRPARQRQHSYVSLRDTACRRIAHMHAVRFLEPCSGNPTCMLL